MRGAKYCLVKASGVKDCKGLVRDGAALAWTDSRGQVHDLLRCEKVQLKRVPSLLGRSYTSVRRLVDAGELYPVVLESGRVVEVFAVGIADWQARRLLGLRTSCGGNAA